MASQGPLAPGTASTPSVSGYGGSVTNPNNIKVSDNAYAVGLDSQYSVDATNFGFSIPSGATIDGILFEVEASRDPSAICSDITVKIIRSDGTAGATNRATFAAWTTSDAFYSNGSSTDLWGETWTPADINSSNFGLAYGFRPANDAAFIDFIRCTVYYTEGGSSVNSNFFGLM